jgi:hypothetical protein
MVEAIVAGIDKKELPPMEPGAMCYMLSKQGYLSDTAGHWHPHLMFFFSGTEPAAWGSNLPGSPIFAFDDAWEHMTVFLVPVREWSDGTADHRPPFERCRSWRCAPRRRATRRPRSRLREAVWGGRRLKASASMPSSGQGAAPSPQASYLDGLAL